MTRPRPAALEAGLLAFALLMVSLLFVHPALAHTSTVNVLSIKELSAGEFVTSWERTQSLRDPRDAYDMMRPQFPEHCTFTPPRLSCGSRGLTGNVGFDGLAQLSTSGMIKVDWADGSTRVVSLTALRPSARVTEARQESAFRRAVDFVGIGVMHIWLGIDHLLFVFGLLWLVDSWRVLIKTITAFTVAHSVTLGVATGGFRVLEAAPVEAVIALSIAFVAVEIAREAAHEQPSFTRKNPWMVAFAFGLLHGFGFANALAEIHISSAELPTALLGFNIGVEVGQLLFVAALLALRPLLGLLEPKWGVRTQRLGYYAMGTLAMYWFFERIAAFLPSATTG